MIEEGPNLKGDRLMCERVMGLTMDIEPTYLSNLYRTVYRVIR